MPELMMSPEETDDQGAVLTPLVPPDGWVAGKYASFNVSPKPMFGPDELGEYKSAIEDMDEICTRADSAAGLFETLQAWEMRLFERGYHFLNASTKGWGLYGGVNGARASGAEIMQTMNQGKLFSCNVFAARCDKIVAALSREIPGLTFVPKYDSDPIDQTAADEAKKYLKLWFTEADVRSLIGQISHLFYTDDRVVLYTRSVADEQEWGTETPERKQSSFGMPEFDGVSPETELKAGNDDTDVPAVREVTTAYGKLEAKVPLFCDRQGQMPWIRISTEESVNVLRERYPWIEDKIKSGSTSGGDDQLRRQARINVRLAVQTSSSSGESWQQDATEQSTWYRPSQYRSIKKKELQEFFRETFPEGMLVVKVGGELAMVRNEGMNAHLKILHPKHGSGQNRRSIGANYLPLQKILNANISLVDRYFRACVPHRFHDSEAINSEAINGQTNDPSKSTPVLRKAGENISDYTGIENVPTPSTGIFEFVQWLVDGGPEAMDGAQPAMFGGEEGNADQGVYQTQLLKRDTALQVFSMPWGQICIGIAKAAEQAVRCAAENRVTSISSNVPGQGKLSIELEKLQGNALCYPESLEIPQTIAEQEAQVQALLENSHNVALYQSITNDPRNLTTIGKFTSLSGLEIPGLDSVEQQQGEFELLMQSGPLDNPQYSKIAQLIQQGDNDPEAQTPEGQQALQQLQESLKNTPPKVSSVAIAPDESENHQIHASVVLGLLTSPEGRKLKNGNAEQKAIWENLKLHWQEHTQMALQLTPPKEIDFKGNVSVDPSKFAPDAQAKMFEAMGLQVAPEDLKGANELEAHEVITEKEGVDEQGVPVKQKISMVNPGGKLQ